MSKLKTATGKEFPCDFMGESIGYGTLFVLVDIPLEDIIPVFNNPEETSVLQWLGDDGEVVREEKGYTVFTGYQIVQSSCPIRVRMAKPNV